MKPSSTRARIRRARAGWTALLAALFLARRLPAAAKLELDPYVSRAASPAALSDVLAITRANFDAEVRYSDLPILLEYTNALGNNLKWDWILETLASSNKGRRKVGRIDIDKEPDLARSAGVTGEHGLPVFYLHVLGRKLAKVYVICDVDARGGITGIRLIPAEPAR